MEGSEFCRHAVELIGESSSKEALNLVLRYILYAYIYHHVIH